MPHTSNRIYSEVVNGVKVGINSDDIGAVLGEASHDIGTLVKSKKIVIWARNKPEAIGGPEDITDAQRKANNFGLTPPSIYTSIPAYAAAAYAGNLANAWSYQRVSPYIYDSSGNIIGGNGDWARYTDFDNYRSNSECPFPTLVQGNYIFGESSGQKTLRIALAQSHQAVQGSTDYLHITDFNKPGLILKNWYVGVLLMRSASDYKIVTSSTTIANGADSVYMDTSNAFVMPVEGVHRAFAFFANTSFKVQSSGSTAVSALQIIPITSQYVDITLITSASALVVSVSGQGGRIVVTVVNKNASAVTITPVEFQRSVNGTGNDAATLTVLDTLSPFSVAAGTPQNPTVITKTYSAPIVGMTGAIRLVYKFKIGNGTTSVNQTTDWTTLMSGVLPPSID